MNDTGHHVPPKLWGALLAIAAIALIARVFVHHHGHFGIDDTYAFYSWYALIAAVVGIGVARLVAAVLGREEDSSA